MTQDTEDVVALVNYLRRVSAMPEERKAADLIQSLSDRIDVLEAERGRVVAALDRRSVATMDPPWTAAYNAALDAVRAALHQEGIAP